MHQALLVDRWCGDVQGDSVHPGGPPRRRRITQSERDIVDTSLSHG